LRLTVELADHGGVIWADRFDGALGSIFEMQDAIALRVASIVAPHLRSHELARAHRKRPDSLTAYDLTLQALSLIHKLERRSFLEARRLLERAVECDAAYAPAYSHLASLGMRWIGQGWSDDEDADRLAASRAAQMAIERDASDAVGLAIYGHLRSYLLRDYNSAHEYLKRALAAGPSCAWAWAYSGLTLGYTGEVSRAVEHGEHAVRLSPLGIDAFWLEHYLSQAYYLAGRHEEAITWGRASAAKGANNASNLRCLIASLVAAGHRAEAGMVARQLLDFIPEYRVELFRSRTPLRDEARELFATRLIEAGIPD
jgi:tetratricopeptide (TPR) repeat protein